MSKLESIKKALVQTPEASVELGTRVQKLEGQLRDIQFTLDGPQAKASWEELPPMAMPLNNRMSVMIRTHWSSTSELTKTERDQLEILKEEFLDPMDISAYRLDVIELSGNEFKVWF